MSMSIYDHTYSYFMFIAVPAHGDFYGDED